MHAKRNYYRNAFNRYSTNMKKTWQTINETLIAENENKISQKNSNWQMVIQFQNPNKLLMPLMISSLALATGGYKCKDEEKFQSIYAKKD